MNEIDQAIYSRLVGDSQLRNLLGGSAVYHLLAPQGADPPYVVFQEIDAPDQYTFGRRVWTDARYQIKTVTTGASTLLAGSVEARIDALLTDQTLTVGGAAALVVRRRRRIPEYAEVETGGVRINHVGAEYQIGIGG